MDLKAMKRMRWARLLPLFIVEIIASPLLAWRYGIGLASAIVISSAVILSAATMTGTKKPRVESTSEAHEGQLARAYRLGIKRPRAVWFVTWMSGIAFLLFIPLSAVLNRAWGAAGRGVADLLFLAITSLIAALGVDEIRRDRRFRRIAPDLHQVVSIWTPRRPPRRPEDAELAAGYRRALRAFWKTGRDPQN